MGLYNIYPNKQGHSKLVFINKIRISERDTWIRVGLNFATCSFLLAKMFTDKILNTSGFHMYTKKNLDGSLSPGTAPLPSMELLQHGIRPRSLYNTLFICTVIQIFWYQESLIAEVSPHEICLVLRNISFTFLSNIIC